MELPNRLNTSDCDRLYRRMRLLLIVALCVAVVEGAGSGDEQPTALRKRIVGGTATHISKYPFIVSVRQKPCKGCAYEHRCSGTIYRANAILTAASCVRLAEAPTTHIVAGTSYRTDAIKDGQVFPVEKIVLHQNATIDLAVLFLGLHIPVESNLATKLVSLASDVPAVGQAAFVAGWGLTAEGGDYSEVLNEIQVPIVERSVCAAAYKWNEITENEICAGYDEGGHDACQGDAGSPLLVNDKLVGLASYGYGCGRPQQPGVYLNVVHLRDWIAHYVDGVHIAFL